MKNTKTNWIRLAVAFDVAVAIQACVAIFGHHVLETLLSHKPLQWQEMTLVVVMGVLSGGLLAWIAKGFPAVTGFLMSLFVPLWMLQMDDWSVGLDRAVTIILRGEANFAAIYLGAFAVFMIRGGGQAYPRFIGLRYLRFKMITSISVVGVAFGVAGLAVALSIMSGFEAELKDKVIGSNAHAVIQKRGFDFSEYRTTMAKVERLKDVVAASPFVFSEVMVRFDKQLSGVFLKGIDTATISSVHPLKLQEGSVDDLDKGPLPGIIMGKTLKEFLGVALGDPVEVLTPTGDDGGFGGPLPRSKTFRLVGVFHTGMYEFDAKSVYISLKDAQDFFSLGDSVTGIALRLTDAGRAGPICDEVVASLDGYPYYTRTWYDLNRNLFSALKLQKVGMFIVLVIVILVSAFGVIATLIMLVWEKVKEIAILKSMGATPDGIMKIFMIEGITIGTVGTTLGVLLGWAACALLSWWGMSLDPEVYYIEHLPVQSHPLEIALVAGVALHICFIATIYPSRRAARLTPVQGLRYD